MSLLPKGGADMCTRCGCQDREICELCGGNLVGGEQYESLLQALNELNAIYYGEEVNNND